jgi:hypothetical protein
MKKIFSQLFISSILILTVVLAPAQASAQISYPTLPPSNTGPSYTAEGQAILNEANTAEGSANRNFNYIQGIYNRGDDATKAKLTQILGEANTLITSARVNGNHVLNAVRTKDYTRAREKLGFLKYEASQLEALAKRATAATGKSEAQINSEAEAAANKQSCFNKVGVPTNIGVCIKEIVGWGFYLILVIFAWGIRLTGYLLDQSIYYTVLDIKNSLDGITAIGIAWRLFRDLANLSFIFILLYVAVATILQVQSANARRTILQIIIAAILINFSLFITKIIIDASNIVTLAFYSKLNLGTSNLSAAFMQMLGLSGIFTFENSSTVVNDWAQSWPTLFAASIGSGIVLFIAAFSFLAVAWLLIYRFVVIIFLLITSPIAFLGNLIPKTHAQSKRWWDALVGQALFPPIYMLFIWITFLIGQNLFDPGDPTPGNKSLLNTFIGSTQNGFAANSIDVVIRFIIIIIFLNAALVLAKTQAGKGAGGAERFMKWGLKGVDGLRGMTGRGLVRARIPGTSIGVKALDEKIKNSKYGNYRLTKFMRGATTGAAVEAKFGSSGSVASVDKENKELKAVRAGIDRQKTHENAIVVGMKSGATPEQKAAMQRSIADMTDKEIMKLGAIKLADKNVVEALSSRHIEAIDKNEEFTDEQRGKIKAARFAPLLEALRNPAGNPKPLVRKLSDKEIEMLPPEVFDTSDPTNIMPARFVENMSSSQIDSIIKGSRYTATQKQQVRDLRKAPLTVAIAAAGPLAAAPGYDPRTTPQALAIKGALGKLGNNEVAKLDDAVLTDPVVMDQLNAKMLEKIADEKDAGVLSTIGNYVKTRAPVTPGSYLDKYGADHPANTYVTTGQGQGIF